VTEFKTLTRLAERYELLILHWSRNNVETFVVQDEGTTYLYRCDVNDSSIPIDPDAMATPLEGGDNASLYSVAAEAPHAG
jgi:signal peptidase I